MCKFLCNLRLVLFFALTLGSSGEAQAEDECVLVLTEVDAKWTFDARLRASLSKEMEGIKTDKKLLIDGVANYNHESHTGTESYTDDGNLTAVLKKRYEGMNIRTVATVSSSAAQFLDDHPELWPDAKRYAFKISWQPENSILVPTDADPVRVIETMQRFQRNLTKIYWLGNVFPDLKIKMEEAIEIYFHDIELDTRHARDINGLLKALSQTDSAAILYTPVAPHRPDRTRLREINAPIFTLFDEHIKFPVLGGFVTSPDKLAKAIIKTMVLGKPAIGMSTGELVLDYNMLYSHPNWQLAAPDTARIINTPQVTQPFNRTPFYFLALTGIGCFFIYIWLHIRQLKTALERARMELLSSENKGQSASSIERNKVEGEREIEKHMLRSAIRDIRNLSAKTRGNPQPATGEIITKGLTPFTQIKSMLAIERQLKNTVDISLLHGEKLTLKEEPVRLIESIKSVINRVQSNEDDSTPPVLFRRPPHFKDGFISDRHRFKQLIECLITGARARSETSPVTLEIRNKQKSEDENATVEITVTDQGQSHQAGKHDTRKSAGIAYAVSDGKKTPLETNTYLAIKIAEAMKGKCTVHVAKNVSTTITVSLPLTPLQGFIREQRLR